MRKLPPHIRPSSSDKWLNCPGWLSAAASVRDEGEENIHMARGTAAHALMELSMRLGASPESMHDADLYVSPVHGVIRADEEIVSAVQTAYNYVQRFIQERDNNVHLMIEHAVQAKFGSYRIPGTMDLGIWAPRTRELLVLDYKNGVSHVADPASNSQLLLYTLGALDELRQGGNEPSRVLTAIAQPRAVDALRQREAVRVEQVTLRTLAAFSTRAATALDAATKPNAPRRAGTHCRFCAVAGSCNALAAHNMNTALTVFVDIDTSGDEVRSPAGLSGKQLAHVLDQLPLFQSWLAAVRAEALRRMQHHNGAGVPGYKLVAGRTQRTWINPVAVLRLLRKQGFPVEECAPPVLKGPAHVERVAKKHKLPMTTLLPYVGRTRAALHIAPQSDPRPAVENPAAAEFSPLPDEE